MYFIRVYPVVSILLNPLNLYNIFLPQFPHSSKERYGLILGKEQIGLILLDSSRTWASPKVLTSESKSKSVSCKNESESESKPKSTESGLEFKSGLQS